MLISRSKKSLLYKAFCWQVWYLCIKKLTSGKWSKFFHLRIGGMVVRTFDQINENRVIPHVKSAIPLHYLVSLDCTVASSCVEVLTKCFLVPAGWDDYVQESWGQWLTNPSCWIYVSWIGPLKSFWSVKLIWKKTKTTSVSCKESSLIKLSN